MTKHWHIGIRRWRTPATHFGWSVPDLAASDILIAVEMKKFSHHTLPIFLCRFLVVFVVVFFSSKLLVKRLGNIHVGRVTTVPGPPVDNVGIYMCSLRNAYIG